MAIHVEYVLDREDVPQECIGDCSSPGDVSESVDYWRGKLGFTVDRAKAIDCLKGYGAWEDEELEGFSDEDIERRILWLACGDFQEGSDIFVLE
jgi:hypothetical protein